jgi:hypothetical protein
VAEFFERLADGGEPGLHGDSEDGVVEAGDRDVGGDADAVLVEPPQGARRAEIVRADDRVRQR